MDKEYDLHCMTKLSFLWNSYERDEGGGIGKDVVEVV